MSFFGLESQMPDLTVPAFTLIKRSSSTKDTDLHPAYSKVRFHGPSISAEMLAFIQAPSVITSSHRLHFVGATLQTRQPDNGP
jgi:hypothetical protein